MSIVLDYLQFPFFVRALTVGSLIGLLLAWIGNYVVLRREVLFTHSISNVGFLGIAFAILLSLPIMPALLISCGLAAILITILQRQKVFAKDSLLEIVAQVSLALAIIVISLFSGYSINIEQFLFGDVLAISKQDVRISIFLSLIVGVLLVFFHRRFLQISLSELLSHSVVRRKKLINLLLIALITVVIALSINVIGVLLVASFVTIPPNIAKLLARSLRQTFIFSLVIGVLATVIGLFGSAIFDLPTGPSIIVVLGLMLTLAVVFRRR